MWQLWEDLIRVKVPLPLHPCFSICHLQACVVAGWSRGRVQTLGLQSRLLGWVFQMLGFQAPGMGGPDAGVPGSWDGVTCGRRTAFFVSLMLLAFGTHMIRAGTQLRMSSQKRKNTACKEFIFGLLGGSGQAPGTLQSPDRPPLEDLALP